MPGTNVFFHDARAPGCKHVRYHWKSYLLPSHPTLTRYSSIEHFAHDLLLIFDNALKFNEPNSLIASEAKRLKELARNTIHQLKQPSDSLLQQPQQSEVLQAYCICGRPGGGGFMLECTSGTGGCNGWIHPEVSCSFPPLLEFAYLMLPRTVIFFSALEWMPRR